MKSKRSVRDAALLLLSHREHTRFELAEKLLRRGYGSAETDALLDEFVAMGFLCEKRAAELLLQHALEDRHHGLRYWRKKMVERGFPDALISGTLEQLRDEVDEMDAATELAAALAVRGKTPEQVARVLDSRGFAGDCIAYALQKLRLDNCEFGS